MSNDFKNVPPTRCIGDCADLATIKTHLGLNGSSHVD